MRIGYDKGIPTGAGKTAAEYGRGVLGKSVVPHDEAGLTVAQESTAIGRRRIIGKAAPDQRITRSAAGIKTAAAIVRHRRGGRVVRKTAVMKRYIGHGIQRDPAAI